MSECEFCLDAEASFEALLQEMADANRRSVEAWSVARVLFENLLHFASECGEDSLAIAKRWLKEYPVLGEGDPVLARLTAAEVVR